MIDLQRPPVQPATSDLDRVLAMVAPQAREAFARTGVEAFARTCRDLYAERGGPVGLAYARHAPACAILLGADAAVALAETMAAVAADAGAPAAASLAAAALRAARLLADAAGFGQWLRTARLLAREAPASVGPVLGRSESLLAELGAAGFADWVGEGLRATDNAPERRLAFFAAASRQARQALSGAAAADGLATLRRQLAAFLLAGWRLSPLLAEATPQADQPPARRASFDAGRLRMPPVFRGFIGAESARLFRAAAAHVAAHMAHGRTAKFAVGSLKPAQVVLVSLVEDARVELLAMRALPGLRRLWLPFHLARPAPGPATAAALMARLARALFDPAYADDDAWVDRGRTLFAARLDRIDDPAISREVGGVLGNDLGQMRLQFDARTHVVEPAYRDDNLGLWDFPPGGAPDAAEARSMRPDTAPGTDDAMSAGAPADAGTSRPVAVTADIGVPVARYPEWDHLIGRERPDWATLVEYEPAPGDARVIDAMLARDPALAVRIQNLVRAAKIGLPVRLRRQPDGDQLDLDAAITTTIERRMGQGGDAPAYVRHERRLRDLSVLLLLDTSRSTRDVIAGVGRSVLELEIHAAALLSQAMSGLRDPFAVRAFCSDGRGDVRYYRIKDFAAPYDDAARRRLAGLAGQFSTRVGTALRHAGAELATQTSHRRLLLVITDGEPSDIDVSDRRYLVEDARHAVHGLSRAGIDAFCVGLQGAGEERLRRVFGRHNVLHVDRIERLPERLAALYFRMTG
jgi:hypothetical protein